VNERMFIALIALFVLLSGFLCSLYFGNLNNCHKIEYQKQGITKQTTVCEGTK
jgi:hypothetical protein